MKSNSVAEPFRVKATMYRKRENTLKRCKIEATQLSYGKVIIN